MSRIAESLDPQAFGGTTYIPHRDHDRLSRQLDAVRRFMLTSKGWHTLEAISLAVGAPEASVSARLRDLRKPKYGLTVERRYIRRGLYEYRVLSPAPSLRSR